MTERGHSSCLLAVTAQFVTEKQYQDESQKNCNDNLSHWTSNKYIVRIIQQIERSV